MPFRTLLFWTHLVAGVVAGAVIFVMSFTGAALALQPQVLAWAERDMRVVTPPAGGEWLGAEAILARVAAARPGEPPTGLTREHDPAAAVAVTLAPRAEPSGAAAPGGRRRGPQATAYVNPYTGAILGEVDQASFARRFFRLNTDWHRWLAVEGEGRASARWVTGVSNAAFLVLALTGLYIWVPRAWSAGAVRAVALFRGGLSGKARDFNWHNVIGLWAGPVIVVLTFTGMCISFPKTYDVIYAVTGIERPAPPGRPGAGDREQAPRPRGGTRGPRLAEAAKPQGGEIGSRLAEAVKPQGGEIGPRLAEAAKHQGGEGGVNAAWAVAEQQMPTWRSIAMRLPDGAGRDISFTMNERGRLNSRARSTLTVDAATAAVVEWTPWDATPAAQRLRTWMRFGHTGELWGLPGQIIAGLASAGGCVLVWTGLALAWRRFTAWRGRRGRLSTPAARQAA
ncbi:MAG: PepSY-associated TM helix domain-containing protein [Vicinamibacterales bacterium]